MSKRLKNGYLWATEKQEIWEEMAEEKTRQLDEILNTHLEWFTHHSTVSDLLSWKKPRYELRGGNKSKKTAQPESVSNKQQQTNTSEQNNLMTNEALLNDEERTENQTNNETDLKNKSTTDETDEAKNKDLLIDQDEVMDENQAIHKEQLEKKDPTPRPSAEDLLMSEIPNSNNEKSNICSQIDDSPEKANDPMETSSDSDSDNELSLSAIDSKIKVVIQSSDQFTEEKEEDNNTDIRSDESVISIGQHSEIAKKVEHEALNEQYDISKKETATFASSELSEKGSSQAPVTADEEISQNESLKSVVNGSLYSELIDYDEREDEIQLVVSRRKSTELGSVSPATTIPPVAVSPIKPPPSINSQVNFSKPITRQQSSFMSRLFRLGRPSVGKTSTLSKEDSPSSMSVITTKRPSKQTTQKNQENYVKNMPESTATSDPVMQQAIEVSDIVPERPFKHPRLMHKKKAEENKAISKPQENGHTEEKIPSWALAPELQAHLERQSSLDPDIIFGRLPPYNAREIFPPSTITK